MVSDPLENRDDSEETYQAFGSSELDRPERASGGSPPSTEERPLTPGKPRSWDSDSVLTPLPGERQSLAADLEDLLFGKYRVLHKLGGGGMGDVWLVEHIGLGVNRALKLIKADITGGNSSNRLRFQQEAKILAQLSKHPNAVEVHDTGIVGDHAYIEMDYLEGQTLGQWLKSKSRDQLPLDDVLWFLRELCNVMGEAHQLGIVHRDIKPGNIMIVPDPTTERGERVKVLDFGIAKIVREAGGETGSLTMHTQGYLGTVPYSSPEQLGIDLDGRENVRVDHRSDIYSIGVLLYEMLAGIRPFTGSPTKILYDHAHTLPLPFAQRSPDVRVPRAVEKVVMRCLEKLPAKRPQSARELYELFRNAVPKTPPLQALPQSPGDENPSLVTKVADTTRRIIDHVTSFWTRIGVTPSPRRWTTLRLFLRLALVSGVVSGVLVGIVILTGSHRKSGWPAKIRRISGTASVPMVLRGAFDFPEGYRPESEEAKTTKSPNVLVRLRDGVRFFLIEGGEFMMGAGVEHQDKCADDQKQGYPAKLSSYYMQQTEVTNKEVRDFWGDRPQDDPGIRRFWNAISEDKRHMNPESWEKHPAVGISRKWAEEYAHSVGGELPTEQQWEFAARSRKPKRQYVWPGDEGVKDKDGNSKAHVFSYDYGSRTYDTRPVDLEGFIRSDRTEQDILGLAGNVREWCRDVWRCYPKEAPPNYWVRREDGGPNPLRFVIRGGSFKTPLKTARVTWRSDIPGPDGSPYQAEEDKSFEDVGFRVVLEVLRRGPPEGPSASGPSQEISP